jgi:hypothetical protein
MLTTIQTNQTTYTLARCLDGTFTFAVNGAQADAYNRPYYPTTLEVAMDRHEARFLVQALVAQLAETSASEITITVVGALARTARID